MGILATVSVDNLMRIRVLEYAGTKEYKKGDAPIRFVTMCRVTE